MQRLLLSQRQESTHRLLKARRREDDAQKSQLSDGYAAGKRPEKSLEADPENQASIVGHPVPDLASMTNGRHHFDHAMLYFKPVCEYARN